MKRRTFFCLICMLKFYYHISIKSGEIWGGAIRSPSSEEPEKSREICKAIKNYQLQLFKSCLDFKF